MKSYLSKDRPQRSHFKGDRTTMKLLGAVRKVN